MPFPKLEKKDADMWRALSVIINPHRVTFSAQEIKAVREGMGYSCAQFADGLGMPRQRYRRYEAGKESLTQHEVLNIAGDVLTMWRYYENRAHWWNLYDPGAGRNYKP